MMTKIEMRAQSNDVRTAEIRLYFHGYDHTIELRTTDTVDRKSGTRRGTRGDYPGGKRIENENMRVKHAYGRAVRFE